MNFSASEYISYMDDCGLFSAQSAIPECNTSVWQAYLKLYARHIGGLSDLEIVCTKKGLGFYIDPLIEDEEDYTWALLGPISHPRIPVSAAKLIKQAPDIAETFAEDGIKAPRILTEAFEFSGDVTAREERFFIWLSSPQARIMSRFDRYVSSLAPKRRKQMRRLYRDYDDSDFRFALSADAPTPAEVSFINKHTKIQWHESAPYALTQHLWPMAVAKIMPNVVRFMRVYRKDELLFINAYMVRGDVIFSQATCRNGREHYSGLGTMIDFKTIETLSGQRKIKYLDPTCRTGLDDPERIGVAKREVVNADMKRPVFSLGGRAMAKLAEGGGAYFQTGSGWRPASDTVIIGRSV